MTDGLHTPERRSRRLLPLRRLALSLATLLALLAIAEVYLRAVDPLGIESFLEWHCYFHSMIKEEPTCAYIHTPGARGTFFGEDVVINRQGFRWDDFPEAKATNSTRILVLGDSVVFGWGVPEHAIFASQLESELAGVGLHAEVLSAGVGSWNTRTGAQYLSAHGVNHDPDILVLVITYNDIELKTHEEAELPRERRLRRVLGRLLRASSHRLYSVATVQALLERRLVGARLQQMSRRDSAEWQDARAALEDIIAVCRSRNMRLIPWFYGDTDVSYIGATHQRYDEAFRSAGLSLHTFPAELYDPRLYTSAIDPHPNSEGHALMAKAALLAVGDAVSEARVETTSRLNAGL